MKKHRRKIALALALALAFGSAAASAANYSNGRGAMPTFAGAGDALELAMSSASSTSSWIISRARRVVGSAFSYEPLEAARPPEVTNVPEALPSFARGGVEPQDLTPRWRYPGVSSEPDRVRLATFEDGERALTNVGVQSIDPGQPSLPGTGGGGTLATPLAISPVPDLPPFALLLAGLGVVTAVSRRRRQA